MELSLQVGLLNNSLENLQSVSKAIDEYGQKTNKDFAEIINSLNATLDEQTQVCVCVCVCVHMPVCFHICAYPYNAV